MKELENRLLDERQNGFLPDKKLGNEISLSDFHKIILSSN